MSQPVIRSSGASGSQARSVWLKWPIGVPSWERTRESQPNGTCRSTPPTQHRTKSFRRERHGSQSLTFSLHNLEKRPPHWLTFSLSITATFDDRGHIWTPSGRAPRIHPVRRDWGGDSQEQMSASPRALLSLAELWFQAVCAVVRAVLCRPGVGGGQCHQGAVFL